MHKLIMGLSLAAFGLGIEARAADLPFDVPQAAPLLWSWAGGYIGAHLGGGWGMTDFADPFGASIFGDRVRTPGFLAGLQIGYNWQAPASPWVFGVEAAISGLDSDGSNTCFAVSAITVNTTCEVRPRVIGTLTGRIGYALDPSGRTLLYGKGGLAFANDKIDMALNSVGFLVPGVLLNNSQTVTLWGGTLGAGIEQALTPAWSLMVEYDYLAFGSRSVANLGSFSILTDGVTVVGQNAPGSSGVTQSIQQLKVGLNYRFAADPLGAWPAAAPATAINAPAPSIAWAPGWEIEAGGRYFGSWGQFQKELGLFTDSGVPSISGVSRLTYDDMRTNAGEFFARLETSSNLFVKGYIGGGRTNNGHLNDEDFVIQLTPTVLAAYSNTLSSEVTGTTGYGVIDGGFDVLRAPGYSVGLFAGYFYFHQHMDAFGCTPVAAINCMPAVQAVGPAIITEDAKWSALRIGIVAETMLSERVKLSGEIAYLPYVKLTGADNHFFGNSGALAEQFAEWGVGRGVQLEAIVSYYLTPQLSIGVGGRYWAMWTTDAATSCTFGAPGLCDATPAPPQFFRTVVEQAGVTVQASYKFNGSGALLTK